MNMDGTGKNNVYIASLPRSGSTLLGMILNQSNACFTAGEAFYWGNGKKKAENIRCSCGKTGCFFLKDIEWDVRKNKKILQITKTVSKIDDILQNGKKENIKEKYKKEIEECCEGYNELLDIFRKKPEKLIL